MANIEADDDRSPKRLTLEWLLQWYEIPMQLVPWIAAGRVPDIVIPMRWDSYTESSDVDDEALPHALSNIMLTDEVRPIYQRYMTAIRQGRLPSGGPDGMLKSPRAYLEESTIDREVVSISLLEIFVWIYSEELPIPAELRSAELDFRNRWERNLAEVWLAQVCWPLAIGVGLCFGVPPKIQTGLDGQEFWHVPLSHRYRAYDSLYGEAAKEVKRGAIPTVTATVHDIGFSGPDQHVLVDPFLRWALRREIWLPPLLRERANLRTERAVEEFDVVLKDPPGHSQVEQQDSFDGALRQQLENAKRRENALLGAIWLLTKHPGLCQGPDGSFQAQTIAKVLHFNATTLWGADYETKIPKCGTMRNQISDAMGGNNLTIGEIKLPPKGYVG